MILCRRALATEVDTPHHQDELILTLATPDEVIYNRQAVKQVDVPTKASSVGIVAKHVPIIGRLVPGKVKVIDLQGKVEEFAVIEGTMAVNPDGSLQVLPATVVREGEESKARPSTINVTKWEDGKPKKNRIL